MLTLSHFLSLPPSLIFRQVFRDVQNFNSNSNSNENVDVPKKSNVVVPVVEQFKTFSVYEDNCDTQVIPPGQSLPSVFERENQ